MSIITDFRSNGKDVRLTVDSWGDKNKRVAVFIKREMHDEFGTTERYFLEEGYTSRQVKRIVSFAENAEARLNVEGIAERVRYYLN